MMDPGTITQAAPLLVRLDSSTSAMPALLLTGYGFPFSVPPASSYTYSAPLVGDRVAVVKFGSRLLVLGKVA